METVDKIIIVGFIIIFSLIGAGVYDTVYIHYPIDERTIYVDDSACVTKNENGNYEVVLGNGESYTIYVERTDTFRDFNTFKIRQVNHYVTYHIISRWYEKRC